MPGFGRYQQGLSIARIKDHVMDDMAQKMGAIDAPLASLRIAVIDPPAFTCRHQQGQFAHHRISQGFGHSTGPIAGGRQFPADCRFGQWDIGLPIFAPSF
jgi:hypothetical protein